MVVAVVLVFSINCCKLAFSLANSLTLSAVTSPLVFIKSWTSSVKSAHSLELKKYCIWSAAVIQASPEFNISSAKFCKTSLSDSKYLDNSPAALIGLLQSISEIASLIFCKFSGVLAISGLFKVASKKVFIASVPRFSWIWVATLLKVFLCSVVNLLIKDSILAISLLLISAADL